MKKEKRAPEANCRLNRVGGQAVLEGVMMKAGNRTVTTCRKDDGTLVVTDENFVSIRQKHKILNIPILRGVVNFIEMMKLSTRTMTASAEALGIEEEEGKFEKWCKKHFGTKSTNVIVFISVILGFALAVGLFWILPTATAEGINWLWVNVFHKESLTAIPMSIVEGVMKIAIFFTYLLLVSMLKDIRRTFMYHGAEHKTIACFEAGEELTPENAMKYKRFHPRCGTSFMFLMIAIGVVIGIVIRKLLPENANQFLVTAIRIALLPLIMGVGYEILMLAGKHDNFITRLISAPGLWAQRITTKEPTPEMLECAIVSTKCALRDEFPEFMEFWNERGWEAKTEPEADSECDEREADTTETADGEEIATPSNTEEA